MYVNDVLRTVDKM